MSCLFFIFFFFQAEDGIRDLTVTGVQTCALPISGVQRAFRGHLAVHHDRQAMDHHVEKAADHEPQEHAHGDEERGAGGESRSEERRVGKECRSRWWRYNEKKKKK